MLIRYAVRKNDPLYGYWFFQFYYEAFVGPLKTFSNKFFPATDAAIDELLSFQVEV
jgi:hypothetical protein